jgi:hypothetical protein
MSINALLKAEEGDRIQELGKDSFFLPPWRRMAYFATVDGIDLEDVG